MIRKGGWAFILAALLSVVFYVSVVYGAEYIWYDTDNWYPPDDDAFEVTGGADMVIVWNPTGNDFYLGVLLMGEAAADTATVDHFKKPHGGEVIPGRIHWLTSPATTDTLEVLKYHAIGQW